jgi:hypothetical protein
MRSAVGGRLLSGLRIALDVLTVRFAVDFLAAPLFATAFVVFLLDVFFVIFFSLLVAGLGVRNQLC